MRKRTSLTCPDCDGLTRRDLVKGAALAGLGLAATPALARTGPPVRRADSESLVTAFHKSLTPDQKKLMAFPFDHKLRSRIENNWFITDHAGDEIKKAKVRVGTHFTPDQQALVKDIFTGLHSPEYADAVLKQVTHDNGSKGLETCSVALFGEPGTGKFEFVITGRHMTRRCDGDSVEGAAFGGPIFYGHAALSFNESPKHEGNVYWYQALRANELFQALDGKQREKALLGTARPEEGTDTVKVSGKTEGLPGLPVSAMSADQKKLMRQVLADVLAPYREKDRAESMKLLEADGGFEKLHISYYKNHDIGDDGVWDVWQVEGPHALWYFRGIPHVHTWVNIKAGA
jgi:hypothetical protein